MFRLAVQGTTTEALIRIKSRRRLLHGLNSRTESTIRGKASPLLSLLSVCSLLSFPGWVKVGFWFLLSVAPLLQLESYRFE